MRGIARLLMADGVVVSGSDLKDSPALDGLRSAGAEVFVGHRAEQVGRPDAVVVSSAIPWTNPEVRSAVGDGIPVLMRAQVLAALMEGTRGIAVAGTHGKTTTTSMISVMLRESGLDPTYVIGGDLNESGSGAEHGDGDVFVAEADESDGTFLLLSPEIAVITNVDVDHVDFYRDREEIGSAFAAFAQHAGTVAACWEDPGVRRALAHHPNVIRYGEGLDLEVRVTSMELQGWTSLATFDVRGRSVDVRLNVPGRHNVMNAAAAMAVASALGVDPRAAADGLQAFGGVRRRFERRGAARGAVFVDDYAHNPRKVEAAITAATSVMALALNGDGRLLAVFQPHRYSRTRAMWRELGESLSEADVVVLTDVYGAGEQPIPGVTGKLLVDALTEAEPGKRVVYLPRRSDVAAFLATHIRPGDLVLTLGAGDITTVGEETLERIRVREAS